MYAMTPPQNMVELYHWSVTLGDKPDTYGEVAPKYVRSTDKMVLPMLPDTSENVVDEAGIISHDTYTIFTPVTLGVKKEDWFGTSAERKYKVIGVKSYLNTQQVRVQAHGQ